MNTWSRISRDGHGGVQEASVAVADPTAADIREFPIHAASRTSPVSSPRHRLRILGGLPAGASAWRVRLNDLFEGVTPTIIALAALVCLVNSIQDRLNALHLVPFYRWIYYAIPLTFYINWLITFLIVFGVFATLNRYPLPGMRQNIAVAVAVVIASAAGVWLMMYYFGILNMRAGVRQGWYYDSALTQFVKHFVRYLAIGALFAASLTMYRRPRLRIATLQPTEVE